MTPPPKVGLALDRRELAALLVLLELAPHAGLTRATKLELDQAALELRRALEQASAIAPLRAAARARRPALRRRRRRKGAER